MPEYIPDDVETSFDESDKEDSGDIEISSDESDKKRFG